MLGEIRTARGLSPGKAKKKGGSKMSENKIEMGRAELSVKMDESGTAAVMVNGCLVGSAAALYGLQLEMIKLFSDGEEEQLVIAEGAMQKALENAIRDARKWLKEQKARE